MLDSNYKLVKFGTDECVRELEYMSSLYQKDIIEISEFADSTLETLVYVVTKQVVN